MAKLKPSENNKSQRKSAGSSATPTFRGKQTPSSKRKAPRFAIAIMAAGQGTRLKSRHPKVLDQIGGQALLQHVIVADTRVVAAQDIYCIVGHEADRVLAAVEHTGIQFVLQPEQLGTGDAL